MINLKETEYLVFGDNGRDILLENDNVKNCKSFNYLRVTLSQYAKSTDNNNKKICQGKRVIGQLNSV